MGCTKSHYSCLRVRPRSWCLLSRPIRIDGEIAVRFFIFVALMSTFGIASAQDVPPYVREAEVRYKQGDYEDAIGYLLAVPGVAQLSPKLTPMNRDSRARLFFDLGCCYLAAGDSLRADWAFREAFCIE